MKAPDSTDPKSNVEGTNTLMRRDTTFLNIIQLKTVKN